jgi:pimeloyl-ACP methyl ester carboxylesterase
VQLLVHGATKNKFYWSALGPVGEGYEEERYSWVDFACSRGHHTVAIDRLGVGDSSHPDPNFVRLPLEADITSQIIQQLRKRFDNVVLIGHSVASLMINYLLVQEPDVADAVILTGFVHAFGVTNASAQQFVPANTFPRFASLDPGYLTIISAENMRESFYGGSFDPIIPVIDFQREDVQAVGEQESVFSLITSSFGSAISLSKKPLAIIVGEFDEPLCNSNCGEGPSNLAAQSVAFFPDVKPFTPIVIGNTGHFLNLHLSAQETFTKANNWLESVGF